MASNGPLTTRRSIDESRYDGRSVVNAPRKHFGSMGALPGSDEPRARCCPACG